MDTAEIPPKKISLTAFQLLGIGSYLSFHIHL